MTRRPGHPLRLVLLMPGLLIALAAGASEPAQLVGRVVGVSDGDTLTLLVGTQTHRIRLAQIDAPESGQPYGRAAKQALSSLAFGRDARVVVVDRDRYGREVGEVFVAGENVNQALVRGGHAWAYTEYSPSLEIVDLENAARAAGVGLWALPLEQRDPPWIWRRQGRSGAAAARGRPEGSPPPDPGSFACGERRTCKQMRSCEEARFHLTRCGLTRLDGDRDGVPCEKLCRGGVR